MPAKLLDGKAVAASVRARVAEDVRRLRESGITPALAVVLVGDNPASQVYVRNKEKDCAEVGIRSVGRRLPAETTQAELLALVDELNRDPQVHGILVQLPLPPQIDERAVIEAIDPAKDVDAFHPSNVGRIMLGEYEFLPCTPAGVMELLADAGISPAGKTCVVIGRSNIVGKPMAMLLLHADGTVTVAHSKTPNLAEVTARADILVCAVGRAHFVTADMVKPGAVVIDVGMNRLENGKLAGDVDFEAVAEKASYITPVPGGVGPMTRAMLLQNTLRAAALLQKKD
ncbi:bifunctional methylenetetrahydrofolate dehydrogenase/methenyltetrahydrofolate cyclohydrolase FolD [Ethanoligenens harbinense]|uniref:Bifunctional protein FolD n=1 Tax=Ethanoligenens harbinense (strain DSM 18485 / JCM 12961 / CGMCC 1.5033 / YUAN-3) TaxID=663278 RepID=E6U8U9_ETHHY|nr:bifunctional methylenetetrahydrofolate dehydrogenase/methenyltetrahydrofolate cyclohydrolase FolD [Ethanoligenens harbinense]ADU27184.1 Methylenetetrahydrofolate dehydrogenase (NADP(+)) [Ethanoligenens harbinense YUAN-3]AVQ96252.1 bifunctional methylenetetrahydrofolate dehydrogenase/methenyltetrahydrofolate cyclohydrolase FolD [Ethanoligenens harbinense YUAN-3]AYF38912.1 bifunctional methylenetetrahydrofolate dehydrogenase/methenyltetrahydrofolate cyclohydrolase FolD [Ethanoligenens harbinens